MIQQRYKAFDKSTSWTSIDPWIIDDIYNQADFKKYFNKYGQAPVEGIFPTVTVRQIMWALRMKPIKRQQWETVMDKSPF